MFVLKHKNLPYYITWELDDETFDFYKDQINMEMKENGLSSFTISVVNGQQYTGVKTERVEPQTIRVENSKDVDIHKKLKEDTEIKEMITPVGEREGVKPSDKVGGEKPLRGTRKIKKETKKPIKRKGPRTSKKVNREVKRPTRKLFNKKPQTQKQS